MRTKKEIKEEVIAKETEGQNYPHGEAIVEILLDIRDLLIQMASLEQKQQMFTH